MALQDTFQPLDRKYLGYSGKYYPMDMQFEIRGAGVKEIRRWANINENDPESIAVTVVDLLSNCVRVTSISGENQYSYKDIYEHDKIAFLLAVHSVTFMEDDYHLYVKGQCSGPMACGKQFEKLQVQPGNLRYPEIDGEKYDKYFDKDLGLFKINTKSFGTIEYKFSTIGVGSVMFSWISSFTPQFVRDNQQMIRIVQSLVTTHKGLNAEKLRRLQIEEYNQWLPKRLAFQSKLIKDLDDSIMDTLKYTCPDCGATFFPPMGFIGGYRQMFMPVQDLDDELV